MSGKKRLSFPGRDLGEYLLARALAGLINLLPVETCTALASGIGTLLFALFPKRRKLALENLERAYPGPENAAQREKIARQAFQSVSISLLEFFRTPSMLNEAKSRFEFEGTEILDAAFKRGKGIIFAISHLGSWEYLAFLPYLKKYPCSVIVRETRNPYTFSWIQNLRNKTTLMPIRKQGSAKEILKQLKQNRLVAILIDQWGGNDGLWIDFFGHKTSTTSIPARLAEHTGAAIIPGYCLRLTPGCYRIVIRPEVEVNPAESDHEKKTTERLNLLLEEEIRRNPGQWPWGHRRWKPESAHHWA